MNLLLVYEFYKSERGCVKCAVEVNYKSRKQLLSQIYKLSILFRMFMNL